VKRNNMSRQGFYKHSSRHYYIHGAKWGHSHNKKRGYSMFSLDCAVGCATVKQIGSQRWHLHLNYREHNKSDIQTTSIMADRPGVLIAKASRILKKLQQ